MPERGRSEYRLGVVEIFVNFRNILRAYVN